MRQTLKIMLADDLPRLTFGLACIVGATIVYFTTEPRQEHAEFSAPIADALPYLNLGVLVLGVYTVFAAWRRAVRWRKELS